MGEEDEGVVTRRYSESLGGIGRASSRIGDARPHFSKALYHTAIKRRFIFKTDVIEYEQLHAELSQVYIRGRNLRTFYEENK